MTFEIMTRIQVEHLHHFVTLIAFYCGVKIYRATLGVIVTFRSLSSVRYQIPKWNTYPSYRVWRCLINQTVSLCLNSQQCSKTSLLVRFMMFLSTSGSVTSDLLLLYSHVHILCLVYNDITLIFLWDFK